MGVVKGSVTTSGTHVDLAALHTSDVLAITEMSCADLDHSGLDFEPSATLPLRPRKAAMSCISAAIDSAPPSPSTPLRVGIVGLSAHGGWAATAHLPALASSPAWQIHALAASSPSSSETAAAKYGIAHACRSVSELVERPDLDLVVVAVRVPEHKEIVEAALRSGKAVLCEWPLAKNLAEAEELTASAQRAGVPAFVGLQARSLPTVRYLRDFVRAGGIGRVLSTTVLGAGGHWGAEIDPRVIYLLDRANGATMMTIPFGHALDTVCHSLGEFTSLNATTATRRPLVRIRGSDEQVPMTAEDQIAVTGTLKGDIVATAHYRGGQSTGINLRWVIQGTDGDIVVDSTTGHLQYGHLRVRTCAGAANELVDRPIPDNYGPQWNGTQDFAYALRCAYEQIRLDLLHGTHTAPRFEDALVRHRMIAAVQTAAEIGTRQAYFRTSPTGP